MAHLLSDWLPSPSQHFLVVSVALLVYVLTTRAQRQQRAPTTAIAWVMALVLMPYLMLPMYLLFGRRKLRPAGAPRPPRSAANGHWAAELIDSFGLAAPSPCSVRMHADGAAARDALWQVIESARERLDVGTFIIGSDDFGQEVMERLVRRAREGVKVRVLLDATGSRRIGLEEAHLLRSAGVRLKFFHKRALQNIGVLNDRDHRKIVIIDGREVTAIAA